MEAKLKQMRLEEFVEDLKNIFNEHLKDSGLEFHELIQVANSYINSLY